MGSLRWLATAWAALGISVAFFSCGEDKSTIPIAEVNRDAQSLAVIEKELNNAGIRWIAGPAGQYTMDEAKYDAYIGTESKKGKPLQEILEHQIQTTQKYIQALENIVTKYDHARIETPDGEKEVVATKDLKVRIDEYKAHKALLEFLNKEKSKIEEERETQKKKEVIK